ncbi:Hypothetical protein SMAX5B_019468 [Scophthalmus maximus]|uniref:Uncharacterized protein n=1 Tax=Scophthalmus maximus TaxID=52904 RepID=A0A2U9B1C4_SCOMX|nr:Hypothetical protein SMAX5B_019468 [Scophthalmus maximus]
MELFPQQPSVTTRSIRCRPTRFHPGLAGSAVGHHAVQGKTTDAGQKKLELGLG